MTPLQIVKEKFGSKKELAAKLADRLEAEEGESTDEHVARLSLVSNAKLLHLNELADKVETHGGREGLSKKVAEIMGKTKDKDYVESLAGRSLGWLVDQVESAGRRGDKPPKARKPKRSKK